jgi:predicted MFS family arabinose efflux permease
MARGLGIGPAILVSCLVFSVLELAVPLTPDEVAVAAPLLALVFAARALGSTTYNITQVSLRQALTPHRLMGRMNASMRFVVWGVIPLGSLAGGLLGSHFGLRPTLVVAALGGLLAPLWIALSPTRRLVEQPKPIDA